MIDRIRTGLRIAGYLIAFLVATASEKGGFAFAYFLLLAEVLICLTWRPVRRPDEDGRTDVE